MIIEKPKCDECGSLGFEIESEDETKVIPASEYFEKRTERNYAICTSTYIDLPKYKATCQGCGKVYRY